MEHQNLTSVAAHFPNSEPALRRRVARQLATPLTVSLELSVRAEIRRLFHALTTPEYIETWFSIPGHKSSCINMVTRERSEFAIVHTCDGAPTTQITGTFSECERRNLAFSWRVKGDRHIGDSLVQIRLLGDFEYTTLHLKHGGFSSREHYAWHQALWSLSLAKLKRLYDSMPFSFV